MLIVAPSTHLLFFHPPFHFSISIVFKRIYPFNSRVFEVLLILQSLSSLILQEFADSILEKHVAISIFMTSLSLSHSLTYTLSLSHTPIFDVTKRKSRMLVGTGGNAGGQSAAAMLQGLSFPFMFPLFDSFHSSAFISPSSAHLSLSLPPSPFLSRRSGIG